MSCPELFASLSGAPDKARQIDRSSPECGCEAERVSRHSPGPVLDDEVLSRLIFSPIHYDAATHRIKEAAFEDGSNKGMSVYRHRQTTLAELQQRGERKVEKDRLTRPDRQLAGRIEVQAGRARQIRSTPSGARYCIYDTAQPDDCAHADLCETYAPTKVERKQLRRELQKCFSLLLRASSAWSSD
jgi:hypothetical protein